MKFTLSAGLFICCALLVDVTNAGPRRLAIRSSGASSDNGDGNSGTGNSGTGNSDTGDDSGTGNSAEYVVNHNGTPHLHNNQPDDEGDDVDTVNADERRAEIEEMLEQFMQQNPDAPPIDIDTLLDLSDDEILEKFDRLAGNGSSSRKRIVHGDPTYRWDLGIVPYIFTDTLTEDQINEVKIAMSRVEKNTCIRFVPWVEEETKLEYGIGHEGHVNFKKSDGCSASMGNRRSVSGQSNSCCGRGTCVHEIGHTLGFSHEQTSPLSEGFMRVNWENIQPEKWSQYKWKPGTGKIVPPYDISTPMHYGGFGFGIGGGRRTYTFLFPEFKQTDKSFYFWGEINLTHDCKGLKCPTFSDTCYNDGFLAYLEGECQCNCPDGLDPATNCNTTITDVTTSATWPEGSFALLASTDGCPGNGVFSEGTVTQWGRRGEGRTSDDFHLKGDFNGDSFTFNFCVSPDNGSSKKWPRGDYCIHRVGGTCPPGFEEGSIQFDTVTTAEETNSATGSVPDGDIGENAQYYYCCRDDGYTDDPLDLPNSDPFVLYNYDSSTCHPVTGMLLQNERYYFYNNDGADSIASFSGAHPKLVNSSSDHYKVYFCYYTPLTHNCGGVVELTSGNPTAAITSPNYPLNYNASTQCNWLIKAPEGKTILLNFDDFEIEAINDNCEDYLDIRYNRIGQPGVKYCGSGMDQTVRSFNNLVMMTFTSNTEVNQKGFSLTASILDPADHCFDMADQGRSYRGQVSHTRDFKTCLPWALTTTCEYNALDARYVDAGLDSNYCRNPGNGLRPWCYTGYSIDGCDRSYCDVCGKESLYNTVDYCTDLLADPTYCTDNPDAISQCAATCGANVPATSQRASDITCAAPVIPSDGELVGTPKTQYNVGETVGVTCSGAQPPAHIITATCLTDGTWNIGNIVCGVCPTEWAYHKGHCFRHFREELNYEAAKSKCQEFGGVMAPAKTEEDMDFLLSIKLIMWTMWLGADDIVTDQQWIWQDGDEPVTWTNWQEDEPDNRSGEDCVYIETENKNSTWKDTYCDSSEFTFVCKMDVTARSQCMDRQTDCLEIFTTSPQACSQSSVISQQECVLTCGHCGTGQTCAVPAPSENSVVVSAPSGSTMETGEYVEHACTDGYILAAGNLARGCKADGTLTGSEPVCSSEGEPVSPNNEVEMNSRSREGTAGLVYTGEMPEFNIHRVGEITEWRLYSKYVGVVGLQVWRKVVADSSYQFIGQNLIQTADNREQVVIVSPQERIQVEEGDKIGVYFGDPKGGVPYSYCSHEGGVKLSNAVTDPSTFSEFQEYAFSSKYCRLFSVAAMVGPRLSDQTCAIPSPSENSVVLSAPSGATMQPGDSVVHACADGHVHTAGDLTRACKTDGTLTGSEPVCMLPEMMITPNNEVEMKSRSKVGTAGLVYTGEMPEFNIHRVGEITEWRLYSNYVGDVGLQVWRKVVADSSYQFIGQNLIQTVDNSEQIVVVSPQERIQVEEGDKIGVYFGDPKGGVPYSYCSHEGGVKLSNAVTDPSTFSEFQEYAFSSKHCRLFSVAAMVGPRLSELTCSIPAPSENSVVVSAPSGSSMQPGDSVVHACADGHVHTAGDLTRGCKADGTLTGSEPVCMSPEMMITPNNEAEIRSRSYVGSTGRTYTGEMPEFNIHRVGEITEWRLYSKYVGDVGLQVWRKVVADSSYQFIGQNLIQTVDNSKQVLLVSPQERIQVEIGDKIGVYFGDPRGGVCHSSCSEAFGAVKLTVKETDPSTFTEFQEYAFSSHACRHFSLTAMVGPRLSELTCSVPALSKNSVVVSAPSGSSMQPGDSVVHACADGHVHTAGDLTRACKADGTLTGSEPVCMSPEMMITPNNEAEIRSRSYVGSTGRTYTGEMPEFNIHRVGEITEWRLYSKYVGDVGLQVWRKVVADSSYQFIGQNLIQTADNSEQVVLVSPEERIQVEIGDKIGVYFGDPKGGVCHSSCSEAFGAVKLTVIETDPSTFTEFQEYAFSSYACRHFSLTAMVGPRLSELTCALPSPSENSVVVSAPSGSSMQPGDSVVHACADGHVHTAGDLTRACKADGILTGTEPVCMSPEMMITPNNEVELKRRSAVGSTGRTYTGEMPEFNIHRDGEITEWRLYSKYVGDVGLQVWRRVADNSYQFIGQNLIQTADNSEQVVVVSPEDRIQVEIGDKIGVYFGMTRGGLCYSYCDDAYGGAVKISSKVEDPTTFTVLQEYAFSASSYDCRLFSVTAMVGPRQP